MNMTETVNIQNAEHYTLGDNCDGWHFLKSDNLSIISECVPPDKSEVQHYHEHAQQFFYILSGVCTMHLGEKIITLHPGDGCPVPPKTTHRLMNNGNEELRFLVISSPKSHGDRVVVP